MSPTPRTELELDRKAFVAALTAVGPAVARRHPDPQFLHVGLSTAADRLRIYASDGDLTVLHELAARGYLPPCAVPHADLLKHLKSSREKTCRLSISDDGTYLCATLGTVLRSLPTYNLDDFHATEITPAGNALTLDAQPFLRALRIAETAAAREPTQYTINGVLIESTADPRQDPPAVLRLVATDGRRLVVAPLDPPSAPWDDAALLSLPAIQAIKKLIGKPHDILTLHVDHTGPKTGPKLVEDGRIYLTGPTWTLCAYEPDGLFFPRYRDILTTPHRTLKVVVPRLSLIAAATTASVAVTPDHRVVRLHIDATTITLSAGPPEALVEAPVPLLHAADGAIPPTALNPKFLLDILRTLDGDAVALETAPKQNSPVWAYNSDDPEGTRWVCMPINLK